jgi:tetratricopeptide (TPR) repeat protein
LLLCPACTRVIAAEAAGVAEFEAQVAELEAAGGAYNPQLAEALTSLGNAQRQLGQLEIAAATLQRALHVARVNDGLHNPKQLPLLQSLLDVHEAIGDAESVDRDYQQIYWVRRRNAAGDRALLAPLVAEIGIGRLRAYETAPAQSGIRHLIKADALYDMALRNLDDPANTAAADDALIYHAAVVNHRLALEMGRSRIGFHDLRAAMIENGREVFEVYEQQARASLFQQFFLKGEWLAKQIVARTGARAAAEPVAHAEALRFLGDFYFSFRRDVDARREYRKALDVLQRNGRVADEARLFGTPEPVTSLSAPGDDPVPAAAGSHLVEALLDVDEDGWPGNIQVQRTQPEHDAELAQRGARALQAVRYRPRFADGRPAAATGVSGRYLFLDDPM